MRTCTVASGRGCTLVHWPEPFPAGGRLRRVFDHHDFHPFRAALPYAHALGRGLGEVNDAALFARKRPTAVDCDHYLLLRP